MSKRAEIIRLLNEGTPAIEISVRLEVLSNYVSHIKWDLKTGGKAVAQKKWYDKFRRRQKEG
jgi:hypothetical protein